MTKMQWKYQIKNVSQKVNLKLGKMKTITSFFDANRTASVPSSGLYNFPADFWSEIFF